jgi:hypothetical protein
MRRNTPTCWPRTQTAEQARQLLRCQAEIEAMSAQVGKPAWLVTLGIEDWQDEKRLIRAETKEKARAAHAAADPSRE